MMNKSTAICLQFRVALDVVVKQLDIIDEVIAEMAITGLLFMDECYDVSDASDFLRDKLNDLCEKIDNEISKDNENSKND